MKIDSRIEGLRQQVMANCHRSDAQFAGSFSLCGLLLRLRDFYKWEKGLPPWIEPDSPEVLSWIESRENLWEEVADEELQPLSWNGLKIEPFDIDPINEILLEHGLYYGAGYAAFMKPSFFLGQVSGLQRLGDYQVIHIRGELARDLFTAPAQTRENVILARWRPAAAYLWDAILNTGDSRRRAMSLTLKVYGLNREDIKKAPQVWTDRFKAMIEAEIECYVRHEYGELTDRIFAHDQWRAIVGGHPHSRIELLARTIKDLLADTGENGRLSYIIENRREGSLGIFMAQHDGLASRIFSEIIPVFSRYLEDRDWTELEEACQSGLKKAAHMAKELMDLADEAENQASGWLARQVDEVFYKPLGL